MLTPSELIVRMGTWGFTQKAISAELAERGWPCSPGTVYGCLKAHGVKTWDYRRCQNLSGKGMRDILVSRKCCDLTVMLRNLRKLVKG